MPEKNLVLYASPGVFTSEFAKKMQSGCAKGHLNVQMQVFLPLFMRFLLMISGSRKVTVKRENMETEHK